MTLRSTGLFGAALALLLAIVLSVLPVGASPSRDVNPSTIDPARLALPGSSLPPDSVVDHSAISDNADADASLTHQLHTQLYETWHRITGYRMDFHYTVQGVAVQAGYLASIFPTDADARAAMDNATDEHSVVAFIGQPLPDPCTVGDTCKGYSGPNPSDATKLALTAIYTRGPILVEASAQVPATAFAQIKTTMEDQVYLVANAEDTVVKTLLAGGQTASPVTGTATAGTATATAAPATDTPTATPKPKKKHKCKKGKKWSHGKCRKVKKHK